MLGTALQGLEKVLFRELLFCFAFQDQALAKLSLSGIPGDELLDNAANETIGNSCIDKPF